MIGFVAMLQAQTAAAQLDRSGPWLVSTRQDGCQAVRSYGSNKDSQIGIEALATSRRRTLLFASPERVAPDDTGSLPVTLDGKDIINLRYRTADAGDGKLKLTRFSPDTATLAKIAGASTIKIGESAAPIPIEGVNKALSELDACATKLLSSWGADPALYLQGKMAIPLGNPGQWFTRDTYPKEARAKGASGRVILLVTTKADGNVEQCKAVESDDSSLDAGTCAIVVEHLRFRAPTDVAGQPMASYTVLPVRWAKS